MAKSKTTLTNKEIANTQFVLFSSILADLTQLNTYEEILLDLDDKLLLGGLLDTINVFNEFKDEPGEGEGKTWKSLAR